MNVLKRIFSAGHMNTAMTKIMEDSGQQMTRFSLVIYNQNCRHLATHQQVSMPSACQTVSVAKSNKNLRLENYALK